MFLVQNIVKTIENKPIDTALVICEGKMPYALDLCNVFKKVFFYNRFDETGLPTNGYIINNVNAAILQTSFDIIISIGEGQSYQIAKQLSKKLHVTFMHISTVSEHVGVSRPFSTSRPNVGRGPSDIEISMYPSVISSSNVCIPNIQQSTISPEKNLDYIGIAPVPDGFMERYIGLLNNYPIKVLPTIDPSCGVMIDTWLGNSHHVLEGLRSGTIVICARTPETEKLITEGVNGFLYKDFKELSKLVEYVYSNKSSLSRMHESARNLYLEVTIDKEGFVEQWKELIKGIVRKI